MLRKAWPVLFLAAMVAPVSAQTIKGPPLPPKLRPENLVSFDYRQAELRWIDQHWQLVAGSIWLKDFGRREGDARAALRTVQNLQLTQHAAIGTPVPVMEYWLSDGQAPRRFGGAGRVETLDPTSLRVEQQDGQWHLRDSRHRLFSFGPYKDDADQALAVIHHYGFTHVAAIGPAAPTMIYFTGIETSLSRSRLVVPAEKSAAGPAQATAAAPAKVENAPSLPERLAFDFRQVQLQHEQNQWKLVFGSHVFASFGEDRETARQALSFFQRYHFTEQLLIGKPPTFSYFLVGGQAARGSIFGMSADAFFPESVLVRQVNKDWVVCDGDRTLVNFGEHPEDARQLVLAIRRYHFDRLYRLGNGLGRSITFLIRDR